MKLEELVARVAPTVGMKPGELMRGVEAIFEGIKTTVAQGEKVSISRMGSFTLKSRPAGEKVDPETGESKIVEAASTLSFKASRSSDNKKKNKSGQDKPAS